MNKNILDKQIIVVGLGYVGLPLAVELAKKFKVIGYDVNSTRINELKSSLDKTKEVSSEELKNSKLIFTDDIKLISSKDIYIVTVPTPIDDSNHPDLRPIESASRTVGKSISKGTVVIYESTVYPGTTEEFCVPILEKESGLKHNQDFFTGYSPERINPGDKERRVSDIIKVTSGSTPDVADFVDLLYSQIITAGTYKASSIKVAEAAKVIENTQRDLNIAFVNELAILFDKMNLDTSEVLKAAGTKWNFLQFKPGLVGGHCIGVDPYYLTYKAQILGYHPEIILAGRRLNDNMSSFVVEKLIKYLIKENVQILKSNILILGASFKENCPDVRNSKVFDVISKLADYGCSIDLYDPVVDPNEVKHEYGINLIKKIDQKYDAIVLAVAHNAFLEIDLKNIKKDKSIVFDLKSFLPKELVDLRL